MKSYNIYAGLDITGGLKYIKTAEYESQEEATKAAEDESLDLINKAIADNKIMSLSAFIEKYPEIDILNLLSKYAQQLTEMMEFHAEEVKYKTYEYYSDEKISIWRRSYYSVDAENKEEADLIAIEGISNGDLDVYDSEFLYDTEEYLTPKENKDNSTFEIYDEEHELLYTNL